MLVSGGLGCFGMGLGFKGSGFAVEAYFFGSAFRLKAIRGCG